VRVHQLRNAALEDQFSRNYKYEQHNECCESKRTDGRTDRARTAALRLSARPRHNQFHQLLELWGHDSSVGIATRYGLDGPLIESRWGEEARFPHPSRPTQPPIQWLPGNFEVRHPRCIGSMTKNIVSVYCKSTIYFRRHNNMIYLLNFNVTYTIIFATCSDSCESSSGINFKNYCTYCFTVFMFLKFTSEDDS